MPDDYSANARTTGAITVGGTATGTIETRRDVDWFAVELVAGRTYVIDVEGADSGGGTLGDTVLRGLYDRDGNRIADTRSHDGGEGDDARLTFTATESGTHYIAARGHGTETGTYTVRVTGEDPPPTADPDATAAGAIDLGDLAGLDGTRHRGSLDGGADAVDYYRFTLSEAKTVKLNLRKQDANADLYLEDGDGTVLHASAKGGTGNEGIDETLQAGTYYVRVAAQEAGDNTYILNAVAAEPEIRPHAPVRAPQQQPQQQSVQTSVSEPHGEDFPTDTSTRGRVVVGESVTGTADWSGAWTYEHGTGWHFNKDAATDWFAVTLEKGKTYEIHQEGLTAGKGNLGAPVLRGIHDANGKLIAGTAAGQDGNWVLQNYLLFTPEKDGVYYMAAGAYKHNQGNTYTLSVTEVSVGSTDDYTAGTDTKGKVKVGGSATGDIENAADIDWFKVALEKGQEYRFDLKGSSTGDGTLYDPDIRGIYDKDGKRLPGTWDEHGGVGWNSQVLFTPEKDGTYYVAASGSTWWASDGPRHKTGTYTLSVAEGTDDFAAGADTGGEVGKVAVGGSATGETEYSGDVDWFEFNAQAGRTYRIDLKGQRAGDGTLRDPDIRGIYDANGILVSGTADDDGGQGKNSRTTFTAEETDVYYVGVGGDGNHKGTYTVTVSVDDLTRSELKSRSEPKGQDFPEDVSTQGRVKVGDSVTGKTEYSEEGPDYDWFAVDLEIGKTYRFDLRGLGTGDGTLVDPVIGGIYDARGNLIDDTTNEYNDDLNTLNARVFFKAPETATYYVDVGTAYLDADDTYTLVVEEYPDDFTADTGTSGEVAVGGSATGEVTITGDVDWFAVELQAGTTYQVDLKGKLTGDGTLWDPYLRGIHDKDGNLIAGTAHDDIVPEGTGRIPELNSRVSFTPDKDGTYYVAAGATHEAHSQRYGENYGTYMVSVEEVVDAM